MGGLLIAFEERLAEIGAYVDLLQSIEDSLTAGLPRIGGTGPVVSVLQTRILYSGVYLQLYNLVEATITRCLDGVSQVAIVSGPWKPADLVDELRREWVRVTARSYTDLSYENRLVSALALCDHLIAVLPAGSFKIEKGGGGNWDDSAIEAVTKRIGCSLRISAAARRGVKQKFRDDKGALGLVVKLRNDLAHGSLSFAECGENDTVGELRDLQNRVAAYMRDVVKAFERFIDQHEYLKPELRPVA